MLIFVQNKKRANELYEELKFDSIRVGVVHSDLAQKQVFLLMVSPIILDLFSPLISHLYYTMRSRKIDEVRSFTVYENC